MARMPTPSAAPSPGGMTAGDPMADPGTAPDADSGDSDVVVTIAKDGQGGYLVYSGDEPEGGDSGDMSDDDTDAMGDAGGAPGGGPAGGMGGGAPQGQPASDIGAALKLAMTIMQADQSSQGGSSEDSFAGGFGASQSPAGGLAQKY